MYKVTENKIDVHIFKLLEHATSTDKVMEEYTLYQQREARMLYGWKDNNTYVACIGIEKLGGRVAEIKHIAVMPKNRNQHLGSKMINYVLKEIGIRRLIAETDHEAVGFYQRYGFTISSLGEKYPGVERFFVCMGRKSPCRTNEIVCPIKF